MDLLLPDEGEDSVCIIRSCKKFMGKKGRQPFLPSVGVCRLRGAEMTKGAVVLENASVSDL